MQLPLKMVTMATLSRNFFTVSLSSLIFCEKELRKVDHGRPVFEVEESFNEQKTLRSDELLCEMRYLFNLFSGVN